ncbi:MAG: hypothetical protein OQL10_13695 [Sedimenticola sp.]|nr:hypothetical protein [Sedimenticola sp.]
MRANPRPTSSRLALIMLALLFGLPPALGWLYITHPEWLPDSHKNKGTLITPPRPLTDLDLKDADNTPYDWSKSTGHWTLVSYNQGDCDPTCEQRIHETEQIRRAVGGERIRVERLLIQALPANTEKIQAQTEQLNGMQMLFLETDKQENFNTLFNVAGIIPDSATYLIDPNGMLMMGYTKNNKPKDILKDLEILLKASSNWTKGVSNGNG